MLLKRFLSGVPVALSAAFVLLASAPLHAAHHHNDAGEPMDMHAQCAVCHAHAPAGTPPEAAAVFVEPDCFSHFVEIRTDILLPAAHGRVDACRAPPLLLAA